MSVSLIEQRSSRRFAQSLFRSFVSRFKNRRLLNVSQNRVSIFIIIFLCLVKPTTTSSKKTRRQEKQDSIEESSCLTNSSSNVFIDVLVYFEFCKEK